MKKMLALITTVITILCVFTACNRDTGSAENDESVRFYDQMSMVTESESGIYFLDDNGFINFYDFASKQAVIACNKPNCKHQVWTSETPEEQRCNAYQEDMIRTGFVDGGKLYITVYNPIEGKTRLIRSDLDCSNQEIIAELSMDYCQQMAVKDGILYMPNNKTVFQLSEEGLPEMNGQSQTWIYAVNLKTGEVKGMTDLSTNYNSQLRMVSAEGNEIYFDYTYCEEYFDGYNYEDAKPHTELYVFDIAENEYKRVDIEQQSLNTAYLLVSNGKTITHERKNLSDTEWKLVETDLETGERKTICEADTSASVIGTAVRYDTADGTYIYDIANGESRKLDNTLADGFYISAVTDHYIFGRDSYIGGAGSDSRNMIVSIDDYISGSPNYIYLDGETQ